jgi:O-antigen/teichoic acid export membrane protein
VDRLNNKFSSLTKIITPVAFQAALLWGIDSLSNLADYGFHLYIGRSLPPGDFAVVQTVNSVVLIVITAFAVLLPVVTRFVAESEIQPATKSTNQGKPTDTSRAVFQQFFQFSLIAGVLLAAMAWIFRKILANWLNVPSEVVAISAAMLFLALIRPVIAGILQGQQKFILFGLMRAVQAFGRLIIGIGLVALGGGVLGAVGALPISTLMAIGLGLLMLGKRIWHSAPALPRRYLADGLQLSLNAFLAYAAYLSMLNLDLIWVNRLFSPEIAGNYASAVLLRRVISLLPGAVIIIFYPRLVKTIAEGLSPRPILRSVSIIIGGSTTLMTLLYFLLGRQIVTITFGSNYPLTSAWLGWMGVAMIGYGFGTIWLNVFLASRPHPFVILLLFSALAQWLLLSRFNGSLMEIIIIFCIGGWVIAIGGFVLYRLWLHPQLGKLAKVNPTG